MSRKCIYSDGKGNTVVMPARKTYFTQPTTTQEITTIILRDPPPVTPSEIKTVELTTIGIAGAAIIAFSLIALLLALVLNRRRQSIRQPVVVGDGDHVYDEIGKQGHLLRSCFPLMVKPKGDKKRPVVTQPAISLLSDRTAEINVYDSIGGYGRSTETSQSAQPGEVEPHIELKQLGGTNKSTNPYFVLEDTECCSKPSFEMENEISHGAEYKKKVNPYFELEKEEGTDSKSNRVPNPYFEIEKEEVTDSKSNKVPNPNFVLENETEETRETRGHRCLSCGNRRNVYNQYARADIYRPNSLPYMKRQISEVNRSSVKPGLNSIETDWGRDMDHNTHREFTAAVPDIDDSRTETADKNQYFVLERNAHDLPIDDKSLNVDDKHLRNLPKSFPEETDVKNITGHQCRNSQYINKGEYSHLCNHPQWDSSKPLSRLISADQLERLNDQGGITVIILPPTPDVGSKQTESSHYDQIHFSPVIKPRSRINSAPR